MHCKCKLLNQAFLAILGVIFLYFEAKSAGRSFHRESYMLHVGGLLFYQGDEVGMSELSKRREDKIG